MTIYCKQMRDYSTEKKPCLLLVAKDPEEVKEIYDLWEEVKKEVLKNQNELVDFLTLFITEDNVKYHMKKDLLICGFTDFLISHDINDGFLIDYLCKNTRRKEKC